MPETLALQAAGETACVRVFDDYPRCFLSAAAEPYRREHTHTHTLPCILCPKRLRHCTYSHEAHARTRSLARSLSPSRPLALSRVDGGLAGGRVCVRLEFPGDDGEGVSERGARERTHESDGEGGGRWFLWRAVEQIAGLRGLGEGKVRDGRDRAGAMVVGWAQCGGRRPRASSL
eukprot:3397610-Pleurochrysis_carterae.AAC.1